MKDPLSNLLKKDIEEMSKETIQLISNSFPDNECKFSPKHIAYVKGNKRYSFVLEKWILNLHQ